MVSIFLRILHKGQTKEFFEEKHIPIFQEFSGMKIPNSDNYLVKLQ